MRPAILWIDQIKDRDNNNICIYDLAFSGDGNLLLVTADSKIYVYNIQNGSLIQTLKGHKDTVLCISVSQDGKRFASGSADKQVIIWTSKMEGILKYSHNDPVRCLMYNPKFHQLLSCTASDFGLWSPEQKTVAKSKIISQINCCCWNADGNFFALGLTSGLVSIRFKSGEEKLKIDRNGPVWGVQFYKFKGNSDILTVVDWSRVISFYDLNGKQNFRERSLDFDPLFVSLFSNDFLVIGGSNKKALLYNLEGIYIDTIAIHNSWIWACKPDNNKLAIGCQDGSLSVCEISFMVVHSLHKERYAFRDSMTDVVIQHLITGEKVRIKCRDFVKKVAVFDKLLAIQLPERVILYKIKDESKSNDMNYQVKEKINTKIECSLLVLCSNNLILCKEKRLQSLSFSGQFEREWLFDSPIRYIKTIGGVTQKEGLLVGLKSGQILTVFLDNLFPILIMKLSNPIRCIDLSLEHRKIAIIDDKNKCSVYDVRSKNLIYEESNTTSISWNGKHEQLLCVAGSGFIGIKADNFALQLIDFECSNKTFVIGFCGSKIFTLESNVIVTQEISYSKLIFQYLDKNMLEAAFAVACLNATYQDWKALTNAALMHTNFDIARKCLVRLADWHHLELIDAHQKLFGTSANSGDQAEIFLAKYYAYRGLFSEAGKIYKKIKSEHLAVEMFNDMQMYEQAKDYQSLVGKQTQNSANYSKAQVEEGKKWNHANLKDIESMSELYILNGEYQKAFQLIENANIEVIMNFVNKLDKGETKILTMIAEHLIQNQHFQHAIQVYRKIGDYKNLAQAHIQANQWDEAFKIVNDFPQFKQDIYLPYALWLSENERFIEAQQAFFEAGKMDESFDVLNQLLSNAVNENRFHDASYYSWLLANHFKENGKSSHLFQDADIYYAYHQIYNYIEEPFTSVFVDILFNSALYLFHFIDDEFPRGVSKVNILFALTKLGKSLGHYKLVRIAYKKLQTMRLPRQFGELIEIGSIEIRTKPFTDLEDLALFCYRCSATNSLLNSKHNRCVNCRQTFIQTFYSFDILPLVEFEIDKKLTPDQVELILANNSNKPRLEGEQESNHWQENANSDSQTAEVYSNLDSLTGEGDRLKIFENAHINQNTNLAILDESHLRKLNLSSVISLVDSRSNGMVSYRYYLNMMPEISIAACRHCNKFFYSDEFEFQMLKNGKCMFCRN